MGGISRLLKKHFFQYHIKLYALEGKGEDINCQLKHGLQKEAYLDGLMIGYELTDKGRAEIEKDNVLIDQLIDLVGNDIVGNRERKIAFFKDEIEYWRKHPNYTGDEEFKRMSRDERFAYLYLKREMDTSYWAFFDRERSNYKSL